MIDGSIAVVACADMTSSYGISPHGVMCGSFSYVPLQRLLDRDFGHEAR